MKKLVLTGAAGRLGSYLREPLSRLAEELVSTDIAEGVGTLYPGERYVQADLADIVAVSEVIEGADMVVHFGAIGDEAPFEQILGPNIVGAYNVWEAAHRHGVRRVVYASSIHAVGMYPRQERIGTDVPHRPDTFYGLAKCFAEDLARETPDGIDVYWENVGGAVFDAVLPQLNPSARIPLCGLISQYNATSLPDGPDRMNWLMGQMLRKRITMRGFIIFDDFGHLYPEFAKEMGAWVAEGKITYREEMIDGLEQAPAAFVGLLRGEAFGKRVIRVA